MSRWLNAFFLNILKNKQNKKIVPVDQKDFENKQFTKFLGV